MLVLLLGLSLCSTAAGSNDSNVSFQMFSFNVCIFALVYFQLCSLSKRDTNTSHLALLSEQSLVAISFRK